MKRFIADGLSLANLACGITSIFFSSVGELELALTMLLIGAVFDGFDGTAARRWGGTRWGAFSDDIADAVNFAFAPGAALFFTLSGIEAVIISGLYTTFTLGRLVYFTMRKSISDPKYFDGVPSTVGGIIVICSLVLFPEHPVAVGALVGAACALMVSFESAYRHLGRTAAKHRRRLISIAPLIFAPFALAGLVYGPSGAISILLFASVAYALTPTFRAFRTLSAAADWRLRGGR